MAWIWHVFYDFFFAVGLLVFCGVVVVMMFFDGQVDDVSAAWFVIPPCIYSWLVGELYRWPKERQDQ